MHLLLALLFSSSWGYFLKDPKINNYSFRHYIRPQARSIIQDYYTTFRLFDGLEKESYELKKVLKTTFKDFYQMKESCPKKITLVCLERLKAIKTSMIEYEAGLQNIVAKIKCDKDNYNICLHRLNKANVALKQNLKFMSLIDQMILLAPHDEKLYGYQDLLKEFTQFHHSFDMFQISLLRESYQESYMKVYQFYIRPMETWYLTNRNDKTFILNRLEPFNQVWNEFNFFMTKKMSKDVPNGVFTMVRTMHNRWNSILRIILRQNK